MSKLWRNLSNRNLSITFGVERRIWLTAFLFVLLLSVFEIFYFETGFMGLLVYLYKEDTASLVIGVIYVAVAFYFSLLFVLITLASKWRCKFVYLAIFIAATFAEYGYSKALGRFTNYYDLISAFSATREQTIDSISAYVDFTALIPCLALVGLCLYAKSKVRFGSVGTVFFLAAISVFYLHLYYVNQLFFDRQFVSGNSLAAFCQTTADFMLVNPPAILGPRSREIVEAPVANSIPNNNIIFVFDESIRADHLSLNGYERPTTPYLESLAKKRLLLNWGTAVSASTISHPSYNAMIAGATPDMLDQKNFDEINTMPTLFQYARSMNYRTHLIDGQMKDYWGGIPDDLNYIDDFISMKDLDSPERIEDYERGGKTTNENNSGKALRQWEIDAKIARIVNRIFTESTGNFVFIYKRGTHFPYEKNYPESEAPWQPVYHFQFQYEIPPSDQVQGIINSYDNAIRYNLDDFFKKLAPDYATLPNNTIIVYTSDHGESFFANGKAGHGGITREEAMVPLFILGLKDRQVDTRFKASHASIFTALLDLMNYPPEMRRYPYQMSLFDGTESTPMQRFYNPPAGRKYAFD